MQNAMRDDYSFVSWGITMNKKVQTSCNIILDHFENNLPFHDSLSYHFMFSNNWISILLKSYAYENAKTYGLDFIKNDTLRKNLSTFYEVSITFASIMDERQNLYYYNVAVPIMTHLFEETISPLFSQDGVYPYDYKNLKMNKEYRNILKTNIRNRENENEWYTGIQNNLRGLDEKLQQELDNR